MSRTKLESRRTIANEEPADNSPYSKVPRNFHFLKSMRGESNDFQTKASRMSFQSQLNACLVNFNLHRRLMN